MATTLKWSACFRIRALRTSGEAVSGFSSALAALLGAVCESPMGIPHAKGKVGNQFQVLYHCNVSCMGESV